MFYMIFSSRLMGKFRLYLYMSEDEALIALTASRVRKWDTQTNSCQGTRRPSGMIRYCYHIGLDRQLHYAHEGVIAEAVFPRLESAQMKRHR